MKVARFTGLTRDELRRRIAELEAVADGHLAHGRTPEAIEAQARAGDLRRIARERPSRSSDWATDRSER